MDARLLARILPISRVCYLMLRRTSFSKSAREGNNAFQRKTPTAFPKARYGGRHTVTMLPGAGCGPELMNHVKAVFKYAGAPVDFEEIHIDPNQESDKELLNAIISIKRNGVAIKGNVDIVSGGLSGNVIIRNELDLYINVLNCKSYPGVSTRHKAIDIIIIRQNTGGEYSMLEHESVKGVVENLKIVTAENCERVAQYAFEHAKKYGRKKVTTVHKANIMKLSDGLFLEVAREVSKDYPQIEHTDMIVDNCCMQLVLNPQKFDMLLTMNLYGTILSNTMCGLIGGVGLLSGRNFGNHYAVFEQGTRNIGALISGKNIANPVAMLNASVDMLEYLKYYHHANIIRQAIDRTVNEDKVHTPDLGGQATSTDVVENINKCITS